MEKKLAFKPNLQWKDQELWCGDLCLVVLNEKNELTKCEPKNASAQLPFRSLADFLQQPLPEDVPLKEMIVRYYQCVFQYMRIECLDNENAFRFLMEWIPENECDPRVDSYRIVKESDTEVNESERHFLYVRDVCFAHLTWDGDGRWEFKANAFEQEFIEDRQGQKLIASVLHFTTGPAFARRAFSLSCKPRSAVLRGFLSSSGLPGLSLVRRLARPLFTMFILGELHDR